jgi:predicted nucleic acid-binding protein
MVPAPFRVLLDANVLFPFTLRDTLLRAAEAGFFQLYWSAQILEETRRNLVSTGTIKDEQAATRLVEQMKIAFPEALVTGHELLVDAMPNDVKDRHVAAAAVKAAAQVIVTSNLKDFRTLPEGIEAQSPDEFLSNLFDLDPDRLVAIVRAQAAVLRKPPRTFEEIVAALAKLAPRFAVAIGDRAGK